MKKGQVTLFVILGIIVAILAVILFITFNTSLSTPQASQASSEFQEVEKFIQECLDLTAIEGAQHIMIQGGYNTPKGGFLQTSVKIPVYLTKDEQLLPTHSTVERELEDFVAQNLPLCFRESFAGFIQEGYLLTYDELKVAITVSESIRVILSSKITVSKQELSSQLGPFESHVAFDIPEKIEHARQFIETQKSSPSGVAVGTLTTLAEENNFTFLITPANNSTIITFIYPSQKISTGVYYNFVLQN